MATRATDVSDDDLASQLEGLLFSVRRSIRYHMRRRRHFEFIHRVVVFSSIFGGSTAFASMMSGMSGSFETAGILAAAAVAAVNAADLVIGSARKAWEHADLARRFASLEQEFIGKQATKKQYDALVRKRLSIESDEPPIKRLVDLQSHNELVRALGYGDSEIYHFKWYQRVCAPFFDIGVESISRKEAPPQ